MARYYVVGGRQKAGTDALSKEEWHHYGAGLIVSVDTATGSIEPVLEYVSPPEACAAGDDPSIVFKTATLKDGRFYVPTQTELLIYDVPSFERVGYVSLPAFNDVHHVTPNPNGAETLFVANTGLDMVMEMKRDGAVVREWSTAGEPLWSRFSRDVDYRKVVSTKPHKSHPNHVCFIDGEAWVSRCDQKDLFCLTSERAPVPIADRWIHDGLVRGNDVFFTAVNGQVITLDRPSMTVRRTTDLNRIAGRGPESPLGWCRGIEVIDPDRVVVGFSRLRPTKWKEKVNWVKHKLGGSGVGLAPTRIAGFDLAAEKLLWEIDLEPVGMNVIFSIHAQP